MGDVEKAFKKVGEFGQDVIDSTIKPVRDITQSTFNAVDDTVSGVGSAVKGVGKGVGDFSAKLGELSPEGLASFVSGQGYQTRKDSTQATTATQSRGIASVQSTPPIIQQSGGNNQTLIIAGIAGLAIFLLLGKRR